MTSIIEIPLSEITTNGNVRQSVDTGLTHTLDKNGQKVEVRVYPGEDGKFVVDSGHRRLEAAKALGWESIRAVVVEPPQNDIQRLIDQTIENEHRRGLSYIEKATVYRQLKDAGMRQIDIANTFDLSESNVSLAISTLDLPEKVQAAVNEGYMSPSAVEPLLSQDKETQEELADAAIAAKTVRKVAALVKANKNLEKVTSHLAQVSDVPEDADPLEVMVIDSIRKANEALRNALVVPVTSEELLPTAQTLVDELVASVEVLYNVTKRPS